jgi:hypothetical protein
LTKVPASDEKGMTVDHDNIGSFANGRIINHSWNSFYSTDLAIVSEVSKLFACIFDCGNDIGDSHVMFIDTLILDREQGDDVPFAVGILVDSALHGLDDHGQIVAVALVSQVGTSHELLSILHCVLDRDWNDVAFPGINTDSLEVLHPIEVLRDLVFGFAVRAASTACERVICHAHAEWRRIQRIGRYI